MQPLYKPSDVSVCMPYWVRNEVEMLELRRGVLDSHKDVEIALCDDGSAAPLETHLMPYVRHVHLPFKAQALNPCVAINAAVHASTRPVIALTNPGGEIGPGMLERLLAELTPNGYVAAACRDIDTGQWLCHSTWRSSEKLPPGAGFHFLAVLERSLWDRAGGFDERYREGQAYEDADFLWRLHGAGAHFKILDDVVITHRRSTTQWPEGGLARNRALYRELRAC